MALYPALPVDNDTTYENTPLLPAAAMALEASNNDKDVKSGLNPPQKDHRLKTAVSYHGLLKKT